MDQASSPEAIRDDIEQRRHQMTNDVDELEARAKSMTDWKQQVQERPLVAAGVAATAGLVLGLMTGGSKDSNQRSHNGASYYQVDGGQQRQGHSFSGQATQAGQDRAASKVDEIRGALMSLAATKAQEFLREAVPGYQQEEDRVKQGERSDSTHQATNSAINEAHYPQSTTGSARETHAQE